MIIFRVLFVILPVLVVLIDLVLIYTVESIFKLSEPYKLGLLANALLYAYHFDKYYSKYKPQLILLALMLTLFACSLPRTPSPNFVDRWNIFQSYIGVFLGIGSVFRHRALQFFFMLYVAVHVFAAVQIISTYLDQNTALSVWVVAPALIYFGALFAEISKLHRSTIEAGGYQSAVKRGVASIVDPFRGLGWIEWLGILVTALSVMRLISGTEALDRLLGSLYRLFIGFYKSTIEFIPEFVIDEFFFFFFEASPPTWLAPILIILGIFLRAADLHSKRYEDSPIWSIILGKIVYPSGDIDINEKQISGFSSKPFEFSVIVFNFMIAASILSFFEINPIQWLAPFGGASVTSIIFVCVAGFVMGAIAKNLMALPYRLDGATFYVVVYSITALRGLYYGPSLVFLAPFVAWRILLISLIVCASLLLLSTGVDLVRPSVSPLGSS